MGTIDRDRVGGVRGMKNAKDKEGDGWVLQTEIEKEGLDEMKNAKDKKEDVWVLYRQRQRRRGEMK